MVGAFYEISSGIVDFFHEFSEIESASPQHRAPSRQGSAKSEAPPTKQTLPREEACRAAWSTASEIASSFRSSASYCRCSS